MIGRIRGTLVEKQAPHLLVDASGVGYEIEAPISVFYKLPETGAEVVLFTHFVVREDAQLLYGFSSREERELFRTLIKVNGVGPKLGLTLLSGIDAQTFVRCVHENDSATLVKLPGVGKKTAERLIVEMKDKLDRWQSSPLLDGKPMVVGSEMAEAARDTEQEAVSALVALGYKPQDASKVVGKIFVDGMGAEEIIRQSLKSMI
ncbi:ATP-dependent DNA helicase RuvA [Endozoicomonas montiporae]|uniref:Holliday junction branch migration complex subunit RuvA n=2 Tax=Endozoicomonas montiporae TaxID=1027273 RepID=A0A081N9W5_9GAMM|nr:Holliday junction branch migration protein RuvA [Endozoicomonas montiporae]AMO57099.1 Holliday junction DNA helicase RuvA [Endozoicomonas montiporae CL-33]KEQ15238.1 ATP-dependent DNA helicase RuvA [Endozoicomonas montiporae]